MVADFASSLPNPMNPTRPSEQCCNRTTRITSSLYRSGTAPRSRRRLGGIAQELQACVDKPRRTPLRENTALTRHGLRLLGDPRTIQVLHISHSAEVTDAERPRMLILSVVSSDMMKRCAVTSELSVQTGQDWRWLRTPGDWQSVECWRSCSRVFCSACQPGPRPNRLQPIPPCLRRARPFRRHPRFCRPTRRRLVRPTLPKSRKPRSAPSCRQRRLRRPR